MKKRALAFALVAGVLIVPAQASAKTVRGTVVKRDAAHRTVVLAGKHGALVQVHTKAARHLRVGRVVRVAGKVRHGVLRARSVKVLGRASRARVHGVVIRHGKKHFLLAANGAVLDVRSTRQLRDGTSLDENVNISGNGDLEDSNEDDGQNGDGENTGFKGTVASIDTVGGILTLNLKEDGSLVKITIGTVDLTGIAVTDPVEVEVTIGRDALGNIFYQLVSIKKDTGQGGDDGQGEVEVKGVVSALDPVAATITITVGNQPIVFAIPPGFSTGDIKVTDTVEAKGEVVNNVLTLVRLKHADQDCDDDHGGGGDDGDNGNGGGGGDDKAGH